MFYRERLLVPRPTSKLEDHPLSAVNDCLFNLFAATLNIAGRSSIRNLRTRHAVVTWTHYTWEGIIILRKTLGNTCQTTQCNISGDMHLQYRITPYMLRHRSHTLKWIFFVLFKNYCNCSATQLIKFMDFSMDMIGSRLACIQGPILSSKLSVKYQYIQYRRPVNLMRYNVLFFYNVMVFQCYCKCCF